MRAPLSASPGPRSLPVPLTGPGSVPLCPSRAEEIGPFLPWLVKSSTSNVFILIPTLSVLRFKLYFKKSTPLGESNTESVFDSVENRSGGSSFFFLLLDFCFYEEIRSHPLEIKAEEKPRAQGPPCSPHSCSPGSPSPRWWKGQLISSDAEVGPDCFRMDVSAVHRVVCLKQFPYDAMQLEKETLSDESSFNNNN